MKKFKNDALETIGVSEPAITKVMSVIENTACFELPSSFDDYAGAGMGRVKQSRIFSNQLRKIYPRKVTHSVWGGLGEFRNPAIHDISIKIGQCGKVRQISFFIEQKDCPNLPKREAKEKEREFDEFCEELVRTMYNIYERKQRD